MKYETDRAALVHAAENLKLCLEAERDEDSQQWCLEILNGLFGLILTKHANLKNMVKEAVQ